MCAISDSHIVRISVLEKHEYTTHEVDMNIEVLKCSAKLTGVGLYSQIAQEYYSDHSGGATTL